MLILLIGHYKLISRETYFQTKRFNRLIRIRDVVAAIGEEKIDAIIGAYLLTGDDSCGKMNTVTKEYGFTQFLKANPEELRGLSKLIESGSSAEDIFVSIESLICKMYKSPFKTVRDMRWYSHIVKNAEREDMPPSKSAIIPHIQRVQYHALKYKN